MLYESSKHEVLKDIDWCEDTVRSMINSIFDDTLNNFDSENFWMTAKDEDSDIDVNKTVYYGASGTIYALEEISHFLDRELPFNLVEIMDKVYSDYLLAPDTKEVVPSLFLGEVGILLVKYKFSPSKEVEDKIFKLVRENIENITFEALWGAPGTMIAASFLYEKTRDERWGKLFLENVDYLLLKLREEEEKGELIWEQDMYGSKRRFVGAGHGYFGNIFGILKNIELLSDSDREYILSHIKKVIRVVGKTDGEMMNFATLNPENPEIKQFTQWCHGAPGIVTSLKNHPSDKFIDDCLLKSGELIWNAGPLTKGVALCHGTDGNGYAFLQLYKRTGDKLWLDRARAFGMHATTQRNGRWTLFTGELGLALYLIDCIREGDNFPFLDQLEAR